MTLSLLGQLLVRVVVVSIVKVIRQIFIMLSLHKCDLHKYEPNIAEVPQTV